MTITIFLAKKKIISYLNFVKVTTKILSVHCFFFLTCCIEFALNLYTFLLRQNVFVYVFVIETYRYLYSVLSAFLLPVTDGLHLENSSAR